IDRPVVALAKPPHRAVAVDAHDERSAERRRPVEIGHVAPVQDVEDAVGEHQRPWQRCGTGREFLRPGDLRREARCSRNCHGCQTVYSRRRTTFCTPQVVLAISVAALASERLTMPMRYTTEFSVVTLTWPG